MHKSLHSALLVIIPLAVFMLFRALLFAINYDYFAVLSLTNIIAAFFEGIRFDLSIICSVFIWPLAILNLPFKLFQNKYIRLLLGILMYLFLVAAMFVLAADVSFFAHGKRHLGAEIVLLGDDLGFMKDLIIANYKLAFIALTTLSIIGVKYWLKICLISLKKTNFISNVVQWLMIVAISYIGIFGVIAGKRINLIDAYKNGDASYGNLVLNGVFSAYHVSRSSKTVKFNFFDDFEKITKSSLIRHYKNNKPTNYNIVVVLLESWSAHYIDGLSHNNYGVTPNFDKLLKQSIVFPNFYATGTTSIPALQATLLGVPNLMGMPYWGRGLEVAKLPRIGAEAADLGYRTILLQSSPRRSFRVNAIAAAAGFAEFYGKEDLPLLLNYPKPNASSFGWDYETYMFLKEKLDAQKSEQPFFAYLFTGTTHDPYAPLPLQFNKYQHNSHSTKGFLNTMYYADWALGEFMRLAKQSSWFKNTVFIFTADHTVGHSRSHDVRTIFHTPCIIYAPEIFKPKVINTVGSQLDIMATVMDLLGVSRPFRSIGDSLLRKQEQFALVIDDSMAGIITDQGYLVHNMARRVAAKQFGTQQLDSSYFDKLQERLLILLQNIYTKLNNNTWMDLTDETR